MSDALPLSRAELTAAEERCAQATHMEMTADGNALMCFHPNGYVYFHHLRPGVGMTVEQARLCAAACEAFPRALVGNRAYVELVERIEQRKEQLKQQRSAAYSLGQHDLVEGFSALLNELRALLSPPKEK